MPKYWQKMSFKQLEQEWNEKLKESGFIDAEVRVGEERVLIQQASNSYRQAPRIVREAKEEYYTIVNQKMDECPPRDRVERIVMYYVALGAKIKEICNELKETGERCHRQTVSFIIRKYEAKWKIRNWTEQDLNPKWRTSRIRL